VKNRILKNFKNEPKPNLKQNPFFACVNLCVLFPIHSYKYSNFIKKLRKSYKKTKDPEEPNPFQINESTIHPSPGPFRLSNPRLRLLQVRS